jgi:cysteine-rich repeat protein
VEETSHDEAQLFDDETIWLGEEYTDSDEGGTAEQEDLGGPTFARVGGLWGLGGSETIVAVHSFTLEREGRIPYPITVDVRVDDELSAIVDAADGDVCIEGEHETNDVDVLCAGGDNEPECGNGRFEEGEQCDDGNTRSGDGCSRSCVEEEGWICRFEPSECVYDDGATAECGNGRIEVGEECDDGNYRSGDGCSDRCYEERGWTCRFEPSDCESNTPCGNGRIDSGEECDDGNTSGGDGCSSGCFVERGWACRSEPSVCSRKEASVDPRCGDHWIDAGEECDDGNTSGGDGCSAQCNEEEGWSCAGQPSRCVMVTEFPVCGDGLIEGDEQCDDFGRQPGDGCDGACRVEDGWVCEGEPSRCQDEEFGAPDPNTPTCGDGRVNEGEQCDDGNTVPGDGCSAVCQVEEGWFCEGAEPSRCEMRRREREEDLEGTDSSGPTSTTACAAAGSLPRSSVPSFLLLGGALVALRRRRR